MGNWSSGISRVDGAAGHGAVVLQEGVAVGAVGERDIEHLGVLERLLHAVADGVVVVLGLDDGEREVRLVEQDVVGLLRLPASDRLAANDDAALGEVGFLTDLRHHVPLAPPVPQRAGVMNFVRMSVSVSAFLFIRPQVSRAEYRFNVCIGDSNTRGSAGPAVRPVFLQLIPGGGDKGGVPVSVFAGGTKPADLVFLIVTAIRVFLSQNARGLGGDVTIAPSNIRPSIVAKVDARRKTSGQGPIR